MIHSTARAVGLRIPEDLPHSALAFVAAMMAGAAMIAGLNMDLPDVLARPAAPIDAGQAGAPATVSGPGLDKGIPAVTFHDTCVRGHDCLEPIG